MTNRTVLIRRRQYFEQQRKAILDSLDTKQIEQRVRALAADGHGDHSIAELLKLNVAQVRRVLAQHQETTP